MGKDAPSLLGADLRARWRVARGFAHRSTADQPVGCTVGVGGTRRNPPVASTRLLREDGKQSQGPRRNQEPDGSGLWCIGKVKKWHHSPQWHQWMALALLEAESRMRLNGYEDRTELESALTETTSDDSCH